MPLSSGDRLGPYEILAPIGAGGMGEVYKARDTRLDRTVAVKILPAEMGSDPARRRRFEQEARAVAALNHPNIVVVYDVGVQDDVVFLVQELVDGEPLRSLIDRGELTLRTSIALASQIADGLAAAHRAGIVHRDLKPENIMVTSQGRAKILDFGLARQSGAFSGDAEERTKTLAHTQEGAILGTLGYMSPEQVRGKTADARSDIFSFGAVFYEMLGGKRAFASDSAADTLSAILKDDPADLPDSVPTGAKQVALHCLEKNPESRFQSAQDLAFAIHSLSGSSTSSAPALEAAPSAPSRRTPWLLAVTAVAGILAGVLVSARVASRPAIDLQKQHHTRLVSEFSGDAEPVWAADGKSFAYTGPSDLLIQNLDATAPTALHSFRAADQVSPFFSPDGTHVWYTAATDNRSVWSIGAAGGDPQPVLRNLGGFSGLEGVALSPDGRSLIVAAVSGNQTTLNISSPPGSPLQPFPGAPNVSATFSRARLRFSHDGSKLLAVFMGTRRSQDNGLWVVAWPPGKGAARRIHPGLSNQTIDSADWLLDNRHMVVTTIPADNSLSGGGLFLIDSESDSIWPLAADNADAAEVAVGPDGRILYERRIAPYDLVQIPVDGSAPRELLASDWAEAFGAWSRTADEFVYVSDRGGQSAVWISSGDGSWQRRIVTSQDVGEPAGVSFRSPEFSPDGKRICFIAGRRVWVSPASGGQPTPVTPADQTAITPSWSADGRWIAYNTTDALMKIQVGSSAPPVKILARTALVAAAWSPDGKWITAGVDGQVGVVSADGKEKRVVFKREYGPSALGWSRDGSTLYLLDGGLGDPVHLYAADMTKGGAERVLANYPPMGGFYSEMFEASARLSLSRDGKYLLAPRFDLRCSVWLIEGVEPPRSFWQRLLK